MLIFLKGPDGAPVLEECGPNKALNRKVRGGFAKVAKKCRGGDVHRWFYSDAGRTIFNSRLRWACSESATGWGSDLKTWPSAEVGVRAIT